ncbi:MAG: hypothetical protein AB7V46_14325 [Thermomicrobiales bacterium]
MADRAPATIEIGGALPQVHVPELTKIITQESVWIDWEDTEFSPAHLLRDQPLSLVAYEVAWGMFHYLEAFCLEHGLPYVRWNGSCRGSFGARRTVFDGVNTVRTFVADDEDQILISLADIRSLGTIEAIEQHFAAADLTVPPLRITAPDGAGQEEE